MAFRLLTLLLRVTPAYSNMLSVGGSIPFQWDQKNRQDRELASKLAKAEQAKAERDEIWRARVAEIRSMIYDWQSGRERVRRFQNQLMKENLTKIMQQ